MPAYAAAEEARLVAWFWRVAAAVAAADVAASWGYQPVPLGQADVRNWDHSMGAQMID